MARHTGGALNEQQVTRGMGVVAIEVNYHGPTQVKPTRRSRSDRPQPVVTDELATVYPVQRVRGEQTNPTFGVIEVEIETVFGHQIADLSVVIGEGWHVTIIAEIAYLGQTVLNIDIDVEYR